MTVEKLIEMLQKQPLEKEITISQAGDTHTPIMGILTSSTDSTMPLILVGIDMKIKAQA